MPKLRPMSTAPKDKKVILDVRLPWLVVGHWDELNETWAYAALGAEYSDGKTTIYFETETDEAPYGWLPMPQIEREK